MRKLFAMICLISLVACQPEEIEDINGQVGLEYVLYENQKLILNGSSPERAEIQVTKIHDGRCPKGVNCASEGSVEVSAKVNLNSNAPQTINLCLGSCQSASNPSIYLPRSIDSAYFMAGTTRYLLFLKNVDPYPVWNGINLKSKAFITVEPRP